MFNEKRVTIKELILRIAAVFLLVLIGSIIIFPFAKGIPLKNLPKADEVVMAEIIDKREEIRIITSDNKNDIYLIVNSANFLKYKINSAQISDKTGLITINLQTDDGNMVSFSADEKVVYYNGKAAQLKEEGVFIEVIEKIFLNN